MHNLQVRYSTDGYGRNSTNATYQDDTGAWCSAREPGVLSKEQITMRIMRYRQLDAKRIEHELQQRNR